MLVRMYKAAISATQDRIYITRRASKKMSPSELLYYKKLKAQSGPSVHKPNRIIKSWIRAYNHQIERAKWISQIEQPFKQKSITRKIINSFFH